MANQKEDVVYVITFNPEEGLKADARPGLYVEIDGNWRKVSRLRIKATEDDGYFIMQPPPPFKKKK